MKRILLLTLSILLSVQMAYSATFRQDKTCDGISCDVTSTGTLDGYEASALLDNVDTTYSASTGITLDGTTFSTDDSAIDHDGLLNFNSTEHLDWTASVGTIHADNYTDTNTTYISSDFDHNGLTNYDAARHIDWAGAGAGTIHTDNYVEGTAHIATAITDNLIIGDDLNVDAEPVDGDILVYDDTGNNFTWLTCEEITGSADLCDGSDDTATGTSDMTTENVEDIVGEDMISSNTETGIAVTYDDADGTLDFVVDHDTALNYETSEHIDWTADQGATNIHADNVDLSAVYQPLEGTLTDIADGTISENLVNTANPWDVNEGGTGAATFTDGGVLLGSGTGAITVLTQAPNGYLIIGETGSDPSLASITETGDAITITNGAASIDFAVHANVEQIADGTITANLVNTDNPWADDEVSNTLTASIVSDADKGDITISSGVWAVEDDSHAHVFSNIDAFSEANLYTILSDVTQFYEAGDKVGDADTLDTHDTSYFQIDLTNEASLYTALSDVSDFYQPGDVIDNIDSTDGTTTFNNTIEIDSGGGSLSGVTFEGITADPCATLGEGAIFYNTTSNYMCFCNGSDDLKMNDNTTACF